MARITRGDEGAFWEIYRRHSAAVLGLLVRMLRDRAAAEDLLQEVFLKLWERRAALDPGAGSALPWLLVVARHRALDRLRSAAWRYEAAVGGGEAAGAADPPDPRAAFEPAVWRGMEMERARAALELLTVNERNVLELAYFEGLTQSEISAKLRQPLGTVKSWARGGLAKLRQALGASAS